MTLKDRVAHLKRMYWWRTGEHAEMLFVPRVMLKDVAQALSDEIEDIGPAHHVYHWLSTGERTLEVFDLTVRIGGDSHELGVGVSAE
jgi:hypothetical protein